MGEAKRRKNLGIPPREKTEEKKLLKLDKKAIQQKLRSTIYKYPIIPFLFYGAAILILIGGFYVFESFNIVKLWGFLILVFKILWNYQYKTTLRILNYAFLFVQKEIKHLYIRLICDWHNIMML